MKHLFLFFCLYMISLSAVCQIRFEKASSYLAHKEVFSGATIGVVDMNGDGLDDIVRLDKVNHLKIDYQSDTSRFFSGTTFMRLFSMQWSMCIADVNRDGYNDIFTGGAYNGLKFIMANEGGSSYSVKTLSSPAIFLQGSNFVDINGDGHTDLFACHDDGISVALKNSGNGEFDADTSLIYPKSSVPSDNSGNYASIWTDFDNDGDLDLYISKCRSEVSDPEDGRRLNLLFRNDSLGHWTEIADSLGLQPKGQSWATDFADIDNDGDLDCFIINHDIKSTLLLNSGADGFININDTSGILPFLNTTSQGIQCKFADFDNDGFVDLLITSAGPRHLLLRNNQDLIFTSFSDSIPTPKRLHTAGIGDLNNDGFLDIMGGFGNGYNFPGDTPDDLFLNAGNDNHYLKIGLKGLTSNPNGIGARLECYGPWGLQIREVRSGEGYGVMHSFTQHFGLGQADYVDSLLIKWPSGQVDQLFSPDINQSLQITEGQKCMDPIDFSVTADEFNVWFSPITELDSASFFWTFGDGNTSYEKTPTHLYDSTGHYDVSLQINTSCGIQKIKKNIAVSCVPPTGHFSSQANELIVDFTPLDEDGLKFLWTFGDGDSSHFQTPTHQYESPGTYEVCLTTTDNCESASQCQAITINCTPPAAQFILLDEDSLDLSFSDQSLPSPSEWLWRFGDGDSSTLANPSHLYSEAGIYEVCLTAISICGNTTLCQSIMVGCDIPQAGFSSSGRGLLHHFQDTSSNQPNQWLWTFGDGHSATEQFPQHSFEAAGTYEVCLSISNPCGSDQHCQSLTITTTDTSNAKEEKVSYQLFPNPGAHTISLIWEKESGEPKALSFYNTHGQKLHIGISEKQPQMIKFDISRLPPGTYHFAIQHQNGRWQLLPFIKP